MSITTFFSPTTPAMLTIVENRVLLPEFGEQAACVCIAKVFEVNQRIGEAAGSRRDKGVDEAVILVSCPAPMLAGANKAGVGSLTATHL